MRDVVWPLRNRTANGLDSTAHGQMIVCNVEWNHWAENELKSFRARAQGAERAADSPPTAAAERGKRGIKRWPQQQNQLQLQHCNSRERSAARLPTTTSKKHCFYALPHGTKFQHSFAQKSPATRGGTVLDKAETGNYIIPTKLINEYKCATEISNGKREGDLQRKAE